MEWIVDILMKPFGPAHLAIIFALVIWLGIKLGKMKIGGVSLGVTFVLFVGILVGHLYNVFVVEPNATTEGFSEMMHQQKLIINFVKELGLILFVYCIGLQVGPGFFATFRKGGLGMNLLAVTTVLLDVLVMLGLFFIVFYEGGDPQNKNNLAMMTGVMYGAVTNTPGLGAATNVLPNFFPADAIPQIGNGYACAYPLGVVGIIGATILLRFLCHINLDEEYREIEQAHEGNPQAKPEHVTLQITNKAIEGRTIQELAGFLKRDFVCTRCIEDDQMFIPKEDQVLHVGMRLYLVCPEADTAAITAFIGERLDIDWTKEIEQTKFISRRLVVTKPEVEGKTFQDLHFRTLYGVNVTRVTRAGMEFFAEKNFRLQMGDRILVTGAEENVNRLKEVIGDAVKRLDHPNVGALFLGILIGCLVGMIPIPIPGVSVPVKLGLAGGPLVVAILIGAFGYKFKISSYLTTSANLMLREVGLVLFLAGVGVQAGATFWETVKNGCLTYVWAGFLITVIPIIIVGLIGRLKLKLNYFTLMGMIAGSHTDPPALAFANQTANNDAPAIGYSSVYPLTMFLRILMAQLVLLFVIPLV